MAIVLVVLFVARIIFVHIFDRYITISQQNFYAVLLCSSLLPHHRNEHILGATFCSPIIYIHRLWKMVHILLLDRCLIFHVYEKVSDIFFLTKSQEKALLYGTDHAK